jgi:hypothetical protein
MHPFEAELAVLGLVAPATQQDIDAAYVKAAREVDTPGCSEPWSPERLERLKELTNALCTLRNATSTWRGVFPRDSRVVGTNLYLPEADPHSARLQEIRKIDYVRARVLACAALVEVLLRQRSSDPKQGLRSLAMRQARTADERNRIDSALKVRNAVAHDGGRCNNAQEWNEACAVFDSIAATLIKSTERE